MPLQPCITLYGRQPFCKLEWSWKYEERKISSPLIWESFYLLKIPAIRYCEMASEMSHGISCEWDKWFIYSKHGCYCKAHAQFTMMGIYLIIRSILNVLVGMVIWCLHCYWMQIVFVFLPMTLMADKNKKNRGLCTTQMEHSGTIFTYQLVFLIQ